MSGKSKRRRVLKLKAGVQCKHVGNKTCVWWLFAPSVCFVVQFWVSDIIPGQPSVTLVCKHANSRPSDPESRSAPMTSGRGKFCWCMSTFPVAFSYIPLSPLSARANTHTLLTAHILYTHTHTHSLSLSVSPFYPSSLLDVIFHMNS